MSESNLAHAVVGGGCFWCLEAVYQRIEGVSEVESGYAGGDTAYPTYMQVCMETTRHAEVVRIAFDPDVVSYSKLLEIFWTAHDPTTLNRQGADTGTQYRSIILASDAEQLAQAEQSKEQALSDFAKPIVTDVQMLEKFWPAEVEHQDYYRLNPYQPYCMFNIVPKLKKLGLHKKPDQASD